MGCYRGVYRDFLLKDWRDVGAVGVCDLLCTSSLEMSLLMIWLAFQAGDVPKFRLVAM